jgi:hypothetical protein
MTVHHRGAAKVRRVVLAALAAIGLALAACAKAPDKEAGTNDPARVEHLGKDGDRVVLKAEAARRLDIQTALVQSAPVPPERRAAGEAPGAPHTVIPFASLLYEPDGAEFAYTNPEPLVFRRQPVKVAYIEGDRAVLASDLPAGTRVVTVGGPELFGIEFGLGEE